MTPLPMLDMKRQYAHMKQDIDAALARCLEHQQWILGPEVAELERRIAEFSGSKHAIGMSSGTEALLVALRALALVRHKQEFFSKDQLVITTAATFTATGDTILRAGATPVFLDIDPKTYCLDPERVRRFLASTSASVVGILPVHLYGQCADMDALSALARERGLFLLEDVAQGFGARWGTHYAGSIGDLGTYSFFPSKNLGGFGDGGMVVTSDKALADTCAMLIKHGGKDKYNVEIVGYNARLDTLQAAIVQARFKYLRDFNIRRQALARFYTEALSGIPDLVLPLIDPRGEHVFHQYTLRVKGGRRDALQEFLKESGIQSMVYYPVPLHRMKLFEGRSVVPEALVHSEQMVKEVLSIPIEPLFEDHERERVVQTIISFFSKR
jgi:UDP-2-acetamido-2-deoxy-ribo-hexuluronate aminotransferase